MHYLLEANTFAVNRNHLITAHPHAGSVPASAAGKFDDAGRTLVTVVGRLADVLVAMP
jgi:hypothetical protein